MTPHLSMTQHMREWLSVLQIVERQMAEEIRAQKEREEIGKPRSSGAPYNDEGIPL